MQKMNAPMLPTVCPAPLVDCTAAVPETTDPVFDVDEPDPEALAVNCEKDGSVTPAFEQSDCA